MTISTYGRSATAIAIAFLVLLFCAARAHADTVWAGDISISNVNAKPTIKGGDLAHVSLVVSHTGSEPDVLIAVDVDPAIANAAGFDALPLRVYRGANLRRSQPVFIAPGQTRVMGFDDVHLVLYGIQGPFERGMRIPVRLTFQKAGAVDVFIDVGGLVAGSISARPSALTAQPLRIRQHIGPTRLNVEEPETGHAFRCADGSKMVLSFIDRDSGVSALIWLHGDQYLLPNLPPEPGPVQIVWSDGAHSLTWSPGVQLMWMNGPTHLTCGRGGHKH
jgi:copper(I)-binding protein